MIEIKNRIIKTELVSWKDFLFIQYKSFKNITAEDMQRLKNSIIKNDFIETFKIWQNGKELYCLDGFHRCKAFEELAKEGYKIPAKFPADFIKCKNKKEAAKLVLIYSSFYAKISKTGLDEFLQIQDLNLDEFKSEINLPDIDLDLSPEILNKEIEQIIKPYHRTHVLLSFPPDKLIELQPYLEKILQINEIEYEQSSN